MRALLHLSEIIEHVALASAAAIGGGWALYVFFKQRQNQAALEIKTVPEVLYAGTLRLVWLKITLRNVGKGTVRAKRKRSTATNLIYPSTVGGDGDKDEEFWTQISLIDVP